MLKISFSPLIPPVKPVKLNLQTPPLKLGNHAYFVPGFTKNSSKSLLKKLAGKLNNYFKIQKVAGKN